MLPVVFGPLALTLRSMERLTAWELVNMYHGWLWRREKHEETMAQYISLPVFNTAGRVNKKPLKMTDIFRDGRFKKPENWGDFIKTFDGRPSETE